MHIKDTDRLAWKKYLIFKFRDGLKNQGSCRHGNINQSSKMRGGHSSTATSYSFQVLDSAGIFLFSFNFG